MIINVEFEVKYIIIVDFIIFNVIRVYVFDFVIEFVIKFVVIYVIVL